MVTPPLGVTLTSPLGMLFAGLTGVRRVASTKGPTWQADCPLCDGEGLLRIEYVEASKWPRAGDFITAINCLHCGSKENPSFSAVIKAVGLEPWRFWDGNEDLNELVGKPWAGEAGREPTPPAKLPSPGHIAAWVTNLADDLDTRNYVKSRGMSEDTILTYKLGFAREAYGFNGLGSAITFPVPNEQREIVNVVQRSYPATFLIGKKPKRYLTLPGIPISLYPRIPRGTTWALVCEGPLDALNCLQRGLPAVTSTNGTTWNDDWYSRFARKQVVFVAYDAGEVKKTRDRVKGFRERGIYAVPVDLRDTGLNKGWDLSDLLVLKGWSAPKFKEFIDLKAHLRNARQDWR